MLGVVVVVVDDGLPTLLFLKLELLASEKYGPCVDRSRWLLRGQSVRVSERYNVSAKTIRDIWSRRTWTFATDSLWHAEPQPSISQVHSLLRLVPANQVKK